MSLFHSFGKATKAVLSLKLFLLLMHAPNYFYQFAFAKPTLAGHAFWFYFGEKYKKENTTYFLYLARIYKNLNNASLKICKKKFKEVLADFMTYEQDKYYKDILKTI